MLETAFGGPYAPFIIASYAATLVGLLAMVAWVWLGHRTRKRQLADLEKAGFGRGGNT